MFSCYMSMICIGIFPVLAIYKKKQNIICRLFQLHPLLAKKLPFTCHTYTHFHYMHPLKVGHVFLLNDINGWTEKSYFHEV